MTMLSITQAERCLQEALALATPYRGQCAPNPPVGAVVVKDGQIVGRGAHVSAGSAHAEVVALRSVPAGVNKGTTLYVTLEPCCYQGKTPACTEFIITHQVSRVVYALKDPNPRVAGKGRAALLAAGIECEHLPLPEINAFYKSYQYWVATQKPWVTAKLAVSLDGKIAGKSGQPIAITGTATQTFTHTQRLASDAILTTARTIKADNPLLNVRLSHLSSSVAKPVYVLDPRLETPEDARLFQSAQSVTLFYQSGLEKMRINRYASYGDKVRCLPTSVGSRESSWGELPVTTCLDLDQILSYIGADGIHDLWVEAGGCCFNAFVRAGIVQRALVYVAPMVVGQTGIPAFYQGYEDLAGKARVRWFSLEKDAVCDMCFEGGE